MKKIVLLLAIVFLLVGCQPKDTVEISTDEGDVTIESSISEGADWCEAGSNWQMTTTTQQGEANAQWIIQGLVDSGEYAGLCHVQYTAQTPEGESVVDYYFSEDGESGYFEMEVNGQTIKQEWNG